MHSPQGQDALALDSVRKEEIWTAGMLQMRQGAGFSCKCDWEPQQAFETSSSSFPASSLQFKPLFTKVSVQMRNPQDGH